FLSDRHRHDPELHSFPTRRSSDLLESLQLVQGARVVDERRDAARGEVGAEPVARGRPDDELVVDVVAARGLDGERDAGRADAAADRKSTRLNSSHVSISYAVFCLK